MVDDDSSDRTSSWVRRPDGDTGSTGTGDTPNLPPPVTPPSWATHPDDQPGPGMAAPGRHGWARSEATYTPKVADSGATKAMILGFVSLFASLFICGLIIGPAAIIEGVRAHRRIAASGGGLAGRPRAITAICLGSVATFLSGIGLLATVVSLMAA